MSKRFVRPKIGMPPRPHLPHIYRSNGLWLVSYMSACTARTLRAAALIWAQERNPSNMGFYSEISL